jgi:hypothetical protein
MHGALDPECHTHQHAHDQREQNHVLERSTCLGASTLQDRASAAVRVVS